MAAANSEPILCANGCGFYGSAHTNNLCSKCYKDSQKKLEGEAPLLPKPKPKSPAAETTDVVCALPAAAKSPDTGSAEAAADDQCGNNNNNITGRMMMKPRCKACNKKVGLLGFTCRCGDVFCGSHRYAEEHGCTFDVKGMGREILVKQNPLCKADKLEFRL